MARTGGAFSVAADGIQIVLTVRVQIECGQRIPGESRFLEFRQCDVGLILQRESACNAVMHGHRLTDDGAFKHSSGFSAKPNGRPGPLCPAPGRSGRTNAATTLCGYRDSSIGTDEVDHPAHRLSGGTLASTGGTASDAGLY